MICSFVCYFKCLCILLCLPNATVATKDIKALKRHISVSPSTGTKEENTIRKIDNEEKIITKTGSLKYKQRTDALYVSYNSFGLHMCVERCLMIRRCNSITYNLQTMKCGLLVSWLVTSDSRDIETTNTVSTDIDGWRSADGQRCDATCRGTSRCLKSRKGSIVCIRTVERFTVTRRRPLMLRHKVLDMSASILHPGFVYYLSPHIRSHIFMANVRETNAEVPTRLHTSAIRVKPDLINICVGPKSRRKGSVLYGLTSKNKIYHFEEPNRFKVIMQQLQVKKKSIRFKEKLYGIHILNGHLCAQGSSKYRGNHLCQLRDRNIYSCSNHHYLQLARKIACLQLEFGILESVSSKELVYKDTIGFKKFNPNYEQTRVSLYRTPSMFLFSVDSSQLYVLFNKNDVTQLIRFYRTLSI